MAPIAPRATADELLADLKDLTRSQTERELAFEALLALPGGWWGNTPLLTFTLAVALRETRAILGYGNIDRIDWERIGTEALFELFQSAHTIKGKAQGWLWGVIRNMVAHETTKRWLEITAEQVPESQPSREAEDEDMVQDRELREEAQEHRLRSVILQLTPSLRDVAQLYLVEHCSREEIEQRLGLSPVTLRKRLERVKKQLARRPANVEGTARNLTRKTVRPGQKVARSRQSAHVGKRSRG